MAPSDIPSDQDNERPIGIDLPLEGIPELENDDLKADTLEFERINRRSTPNRNGLKFILINIIMHLCKKQLEMIKNIYYIL